jgi:hypothetical protein
MYVQHAMGQMLLGPTCCMVCMHQSHGAPVAWSACTHTKHQPEPARERMAHYNTHAAMRSPLPCPMPDKEAPAPRASRLFFSSPSLMHVHVTMGACCIVRRACPHAATGGVRACVEARVAKWVKPQASAPAARGMRCPRRPPRHSMRIHEAGWGDLGGCGRGAHADR